MRILLIDVNCQNSSTGKIVYDLYQKLRQYGHETAICYGRGGIVSEDSIYKFGLDFETLIHAGLARLTGLNGCFSPFSTGRLIHYIENYKPDVIHIHELHAYFVNIVPLINYIKQKQIPVVWTFHCEYMYTGKCGYAYECNRWKTECGKCPYLNDYPKSLMMDFSRYMFRQKKLLLLNLNMEIVTPSKWLADRVSESFLKHKRIQVIHNGIDTDNIFHIHNPSELAAKYQTGNRKVILSVAPNIMDERKGGAWVIKTAEIMKHDNTIFFLVGADQTYRYSDNIWFIQKIANQRELAQWYSFADLFLICSKKENFPTTCLEALCCGTPVCGFDTGGVKETASEPYGYFAEYGDCDTLTNIIHRMLEVNLSKEDTALYGKRLYSTEVMVKNYNCIYLQLSGKTRFESDG